LVKRNLVVYPLYRFFINMLIIGPILVPFMLFKGLSYSQIMLLQSIAAISVFLFEVPTGAIADKFSRKFSLFLSGIFTAIATLLYIFFRNFYVFALAEILFGLGLTLASGADSALLFESLKKIGKKEEYQRREGSAASYIFIGQAAGSILSGFLYKYNHFLPFWISFVNLLIASLIALAFVEVEREKSEHKYTAHILKSFGIAFKTPRILWAVCFAALMGFIVRVGYWMYQPYFAQVDLDIAWYGIVFFFFNMVAAFSSHFLVKRYSDERPRRVLLGLSTLMALSFILPIIFVAKWAIALLALQQIVRGLYRPTMNFYINHQIQDKYRATVISTVSLVSNLSFAILSPVVGIMLDKEGTIPSYLFVGIVAASGTLALHLLRKKQKAKKVNS